MRSLTFLIVLHLEGEGYKINEDTKIVVQDYADDIIPYAETREEIEKNIAIAEDFISYSKVQANTNKCYLMF